MLSIKSKTDKYTKDCVYTELEASKTPKITIFVKIELKHYIFVAFYRQFLLVMTLNIL